MAKMCHHFDKKMVKKCRPINPENWHFSNDCLFLSHLRKKLFRTKTTEVSLPILFQIGINYRDGIRR